MALLLGIDVGTTSVKAGAFDECGECLAVARHDYQLQTPDVDRVELDPELYWAACMSVVRECLSRPNVPASNVRALAVSSQGETTIAVDARGHPLAPALVWLDNRARAQARSLQQKLGATAYVHTGIPEVNPTWTACKLLWMKQEQPDVFNAAHKFLLVQDFIVHRLTGRFVTDGAAACTTLLYDIVEHRWWSEALQAISLDPNRLPEISRPGAVAGELTSEAADALGLPARVPVVLGGMDQAAGAVGAASIRGGIVSETTGGALAIQATVDRPDIDPTGRIPVYVHSVPDAYLAVPVCDTGGMSLKWFRDTFGGDEIATGAARGVDPYDLLTEQAASVAPGCDGLVMLPHLTGAFSPEYNPSARGVFFGFSLFHTRAHFVRAILEAVALMLRRNLELIAGAGLRPSEIRSTGGGARSRVWRQIKADVCGLPVVTLRQEEAALAGDAILASVAVGLHPNVERACEVMVATAETLDPILENRSVYDRVYRHYVDLNDTLEPLFRRQAAQVS